MANVLKIKRSAVAAKVPTTADLQLGELAINTYDGKLYLKKDNGTASIVEVGAASSGVTTFSAGTTGLTPSTGTSGAITLGGTLNVANGGTGATTLTGLIKGNGTSAMTAAVAGTDYLAPAAIGSTVQAYDADLAAIAAIAGTSGLLKKTAANTWSLDTTSYTPTNGTGATGTWGISISGNAATASSSTTAAKTSADTSIATTAFVKSMFYTASTAGVADWNDNSNVIPGTATTLLLGTASNGPGPANYFFPVNFAYAGLDGTANTSQLAIGYANVSAEIYMRGRYSGTWNSWVRFLNSANYNSYSPTLTGGGASGTWGISISGTAATASAVAWSGITSKPTTVAGYGITNALVRGGAIGSIDYNAQRTLASGIYSVDAAPTNGPPTGNYSNFIQMYERSDTAAQLVIDYATGRMYSRGIYITTPTYSPWRTQLDDGNYNSYAPTLTGTGASGTWSINVTGNAATATNSTQLGGVAAANFVQGEGSRGRSTSKTGGTASDLTTPSGFYYGNTVTGMPTTDWWNWVNCIGNAWNSPDGYGWQQTVSFWSDDIRIRRLQSGVWQSWTTMLHSGNYNSYSPTLTGTGASGTWGISISGNAATASNGVPAGALMPYAGASAPSGWLLCYGQAVSRSTYSALFAVIGTTYGTGDGSTTFNVPDLRGRVPAGEDDMGGVAANRLTTAGSGVDGQTLGAVGGAETHTLVNAQLSSHSHLVSNTLISGSSGTLSNTTLLRAVGNTTSGTAGSGNAHNNTQPTIITTYIIKT